MTTPADSELVSKELVRLYRIEAAVRKVRELADQMKTSMVADVEPSSINEKPAILQVTAEFWDAQKELTKALEEEQ